MTDEKEDIRDVMKERKGHLGKAPNDWAKAYVPGVLTTSATPGAMCYSSNQLQMT